MPAPTIINLTANTWTLVASNVTDGIIWVDDDDEEYLFTYVLTGGAAPTVTNDKKCRALIGRSAMISHSEKIDVYVYRQGTNGDVMVAL